MLTCSRSLSTSGVKSSVASRTSAGGLGSGPRSFFGSASHAACSSHVLGHCLVVFFAQLALYFEYAARGRPKTVRLLSAALRDDGHPDARVLGPALVVDLQPHAPVVGDHGRAGADRQRRDVAGVDLQPGALGLGQCQDRWRQAGRVDGGEPGQLRVGQDVDRLRPLDRLVAASMAVRACAAVSGSSAKRSSRRPCGGLRAEDPDLEAVADLAGEVGVAVGEPGPPGGGDQFGGDGSRGAGRRRVPPRAPRPRSGTDGGRRPPARSMRPAQRLEPPLGHVSGWRR